MKYDVIVIGAGVTGCSIARELSKYRLKTAVLEKEEDVCCGTSKANSAIVHAGFDARPGTWKAKMNVKGSKMMEKLSEELDFAYKKNGSLVLSFSKEGIKNLEELKIRGEKNGVEGLKILSKEEVCFMEPALSKTVEAALFAPSGAIICPFELTIAMAENACTNGVEFFFSTEVQEITKTKQGTYRVVTEQKEYEARCIVNAAGVYADRFNNMVSSRKLCITPRKGEYILMDKKAGKFVEHTIFQLPGTMGKGVLLTPTVHGNLLAGPTAVDLQDKEENRTTAEGCDFIKKTAQKSAENIPFHMAITSFTGLRATESGHDFILGEAEDAEGFFNCAGIDSPGLSSAPAIGEYLAEKVADKLHAGKKPDFQGKRTGIPHVALLSREALSDLIQKDPSYGNVICRCETVTEGEIRNSIRRPLGARNMDGVKRRTRAGMGRCQAGFCSPKTLKILAEELGKDPLEITKNGGKSYLLTGQIKEGLEGGNGYEEI